MLESVDNDLLGLSFNVGTNDFLVVTMDLSSIDLSVFSGHFIPPEGAAPTFEFSLYDNPGGGVGLGSGTPLDTLQATATASPRDTFEWTAVELPLDASGATDGNVILRIDLLEGEYAAMDNFQIFASETPDIPEPVAGAALLAAAGLCSLRRRR